MARVRGELKLMASFGEEPTSGLPGLYVGAKHAVRSLLYGCALLPRLPVYRLTAEEIPLPGDLRRVYCYHVRKTGGTSFSHAFLSLAGEDPGTIEWRMRRPPFCTTSGPYRFAYQDPPLLRRGYYFFGYGHKPAETIRLPAGTFTVTILRDPADRVVSLYRYLADPHVDEGQAFYALAYEREWARSGFGAFLDRVSRHQLLNQLFMFSLAGDVDEAAERISHCDRVLHTQDLDRGVAELGEFLRLPLRPSRARKSTIAFEPSDSERDRLRELLDPEYRLLDRIATATSDHQSTPRHERSSP
jgi:hypothetical protein